jgi:UDP:flavonoid glycosyltransferase YjiC (YdhE family)
MLPSDIREKKILISPLNWGLGHVARCIPLIHELKNNGNQIIFACDQVQKQIFQVYFPHAEFIEHTGYPFHFSGTSSIRRDLFFRLPRLYRRLKKERAEVREMCSRFGIDILISDHRYGFYSPDTYSIFLTHQVNLPLRAFEFPVQRIHHKLIRRFHEIWVLDTPSNEHAGELSRLNDLKGSYIGPVSRFSLYDQKRGGGGNVWIVSGTEQHARRWVSEIIQYTVGQRMTLVLPPNLSDIKIPENIESVYSDDWLRADQVILSADHIVSRSGYSTLMDLLELKVSFELYPTKGQSEQEYLYKFWKNKVSLKK